VIGRRDVVEIVVNDGLAGMDLNLLERSVRPRDSMTSRGVFQEQATVRCPLVEGDVTP
jgi:hypothetical protein